MPLVNPEGSGERILRLASRVAPTDFEHLGSSELGESVRFAGTTNGRGRDGRPLAET